ncbi:MAG TPA: sodium:proton antiporter [Methylovirgula sp.]|nr:sodium:proton antiporter [Methylovirgula sp.]
MRKIKLALTTAIFLLSLAGPARAEALDGAHMPLWLALPFPSLLLSIALGPVLARRLWHVHYGKAAAFWAVLALLLLVFNEGFRPTLSALVQNMLVDYLPFILMLFAFYTAAGGIVVSELDRATPLANTGLLAAGTLAANLIGTVGASMILVRPLLQANAGRRHQVHVMIFVIFLVSNIGGALSPLGNPPLFFGFLSGVDFFWPLLHLWPHMLLTSSLLLAVFFLVDLYFFRQEHKPAKAKETRLEIWGLKNVALILAAVGAIFESALWHPGIGFSVLGARLELQNIVRDAAMLAIGLISFAVTPDEDREANHFTWGPLEEVAKLFAAIFVCIIPVMTMLAANAHGPFGPVIAALSHPDGTPNNAAYFWATGLLSSVLDNAPTYLVFLGLAGDHPAELMGPFASTLAAISVGAVFMGALTYIGNAPNFMIYALARRARVPMPGFFGYIAWSCAILVPVFLIVTFVFFR